ncbi:MAG TPA: radical SAM protein [Bryobacteraceae bacterium]|nr:radical SAM protein [Bryobacteraceae bacterium]
MPNNPSKDFLLFKDTVRFIAVQKPVAWLTRMYNKRSRSIEIDITYVCNLSCYNCNRSVGQGQAPTKDRMTVDQIKKFISESIAMNYTWNMIRILGGEPAVHPDVLEIMRLLWEYRAQHAPKCTILFVTNGYGDKVKKMLAQLPKEVVIDNTAKKGNVQWFTAFNLAPIDFKRHKFADYGCGCGTPRENGIGLNPHGYYSCAPAGGIDRVMGFDVGRKTLPAADDQMYELRDKFCRYCGHFAGRSTSTDKPEVSVTWKKAYEKYAQERKQLSRY